MAQQLIFRDAGAPSITPEATGLIYVDTTNDDVYLSTDTNSSSDWRAVPDVTSFLSIDADMDFGGAYKAINLKGLDFQTFAESTIATGVIAPTQTLVSVDTEGDASADDIDTITFATDLNMICLKMENASRVPTLKHGTGNLSLPNGSDVAMVNDLLYWFIYDGSNWLLSFDPAGTAATFPVADGTTLLKGSIDATKLVRFEVDTNTPTATTRVISTPSVDLDMDDIVINSGTGTDNAIPRFNADGQTIQDSNVLIDDSDNLSGVAKISTTDHLELTEIAAPSTPATGKVAVYTKTDGKLYIKDDAGTETDCTGSGGSSLPVVDTTSLVEDPVDATKEMRIDVGGVSTGTVRVATMPDSDITLGTDSNALHTNTASEITAITEKTSIAVDDEFIIEDSADSNNKKSLKRSTLGQDIQNTQTGTTYTLVLADASKTVTMDNAASNTLTIPLNSSVAFPTNTTIVVMQYGAGSTTVSAAGSVTLNGVSASSVEIGNQFSGGVLTKIGTDEWIFTAGVNITGTVRAYSKQQNFSTATLTDGANISWNLDDEQVAKVTLAGNRTLDNPTNLVDGGTYILRVIQDATGSRTLSYGTAYKWVGGVAPTLTTTANGIDIISFVSDGTNMYGVISQGFS